MILLSFEVEVSQFVRSSFAVTTKLLQSFYKVILRLVLRHRLLMC